MIILLNSLILVLILAITVAGVLFFIVIQRGYTGRIVTYTMAAFMLSSVTLMSTTIVSAIFSLIICI
jgi:hypothetical protein